MPSSARARPCTALARKCAAAAAGGVTDGGHAPGWQRGRQGVEPERARGAGAVCRSPVSKGAAHHRVCRAPLLPGAARGPRRIVRRLPLMSTDSHDGQSMAPPKRARLRLLRLFLVETPLPVLPQVRPSDPRLWPDADRWQALRRRHPQQSGQSQRVWTVRALPPLMAFRT